MAHESTRQILIVTVLLSLTCSLLVSVAAVGLRERQLRNRDLEVKRNILQVAHLDLNGESVDAAFSHIESRLVNLDTGEFIDQNSKINPETYVQREAAKEPSLNVKIPPGKDKAGIKYRAKYARVYLVRKNGRLDQVILPFHGKGLWSTMYGFLSLDADLHTIRGLAFYEHGETPGLGGEVDNPRWKAEWRGKQAYGPEGRVAIRVAKGKVDPTRPEAEYMVDGLSGSTLTSNGVTGMVQYWLGEDGFKPFLENLKRKEQTNG